MTRTPQEIVNAEVYACVSGLVATLAAGVYIDTISHPDHGAREALHDLFAQASELAAPIDDWEEAAIQAGFEHGGDAGGFWYDGNLHRSWKDAASNGVTYATAEEICRETNVEPYQREIFEHWIISDWFGEQLEAKGEKVDHDFCGLVVWARSTTGQAIYADAVVEAIARELAR